MKNKIIAVTGATGQQGGAVARKLLEDGWHVRALTRDTEKPALLELRTLGAEVVAGDLDKRDELDTAFKDIYGVFSVQNFWLPNVGFDGEVRQGKSVADAAKAAEVKHIVYSSVGAAHRGMRQKHFESKWMIEQYLHSLNIPFTILRPAFFMDNHNWSRAHILSGTFMGMGLRSEKRIQSIAVEDVGIFAAQAFANPETFVGQTIELAGDELTESEIAETFAKIIGRPVSLVAPSGNGRRASDEEMAAAFNFFNGKGYAADIPALRELHPGLLTFEQFLRKNGWENQQPIPIPENQGWGD